MIDTLASVRALFDGSPDSVAMSEGMTIEYANPACATLFGYPSPAALVGLSPLVLVAPAARELIIELGRRRASGVGIPVRYATRGLRADGREFALEIRSIYGVGAGGAAAGHVIVVHRDLGEPADAPPDALTPPTNGLYQAMFEVNSAIKLLLDPSTGRIVDANRAAVTFYGWPLEAMRDMRISDINTLTADELRAEMHAAVSGARGYFRFRHRVASGEVRHVEVHSGPIEVGDQLLLMSIIHDVTARDALEQQVRLSQRLEAVGRLAGGVAHEFNNLLTVTHTASEALLRRLEPGSTTHRYAQDIAYASDRAAALTRELLAFSRRQFLQPQALDLNQVVAELVGVLQRTFGEAATLQLELADDLPAASVDPRHVEHVVMNLVINARDASPRGGLIVISTRLETVARHEAPGVPPGPWIVLRVRDEGHGMDEATRARMFEPMFTTKGVGHGTGLGLATVYGVVTQGGGHVRVTTAPGAGTELAVYLPLADAPVTSDAPAVVEALASDVASRRRILVVDDLAPVRRAMAVGLRRVGYDVIEADSAVAALACVGAAADEVDAVVSDIQMPGGSGFELAQALAARNPALPIMLVSGDLGNHQGAIDPSRHVLQKPFTMQQLSEAVAVLLRPRSRDEGHGA